MTMLTEDERRIVWDQHPRLALPSLAARPDWTIDVLRDTHTYGGDYRIARIPRRGRCAVTTTRPPAIVLDGQRYVAVLRDETGQWHYARPGDCLLVTRDHLARRGGRYEDGAL